MKFKFHLNSNWFAFYKKNLKMKSFPILFHGLGPNLHFLPNGPSLADLPFPLRAAQLSAILAQQWPNPPS
jgi:hypothetical protein